MALWLTISDHAERLDGTECEVSWVGIGFGWWRFTATNGQEKVRELIRSDFDTGRTLARDACEIASEAA